ncbi:hypothetical protein FocTR4_00015909 [Fusarium oxysporum f. sp. cubense]|uniref:Glycoside hydrolase family 5 domain-containing protein n=1 Tax=Fusarium oxysporum f. sp. cubense TaxID=61366 RepID=A0A5C6SD34_FUSOC|nr:hypothetical protein FocTR4_00015909 [Fusarium oxysporum f. sp. cubense]
MKFASIVAAAFASVPALAVPAGFVTTDGTKFQLDGKDFFFAGSNAYYLPFNVWGTDHYSDVKLGLQLAKDAGLKVMRTWAFHDNNRTYVSGGLPQYGTGAENTVMQFFEKDGSVKIDLSKLDVVIEAAEATNMKLILALTNNWADYGGMDVYTVNLGGRYHDDFYRLPAIKKAFKNYISAVVNRYKDSPAVFAWEIANEPRCGADGTRNLPRGPDCTPATITSWVSEMSTYIKSLDPNHLVTTGSEGGFNRQSDDWTYNGADGTDFDAELKLPNIDFNTFHSYPQYWSKTTDWVVQWIKDHAAAGATAKKPVLHEEYGWTDKSTRIATLSKWQKASLDLEVSDMYWQFGTSKFSYGKNHDDGNTIYLEDDEAQPLVYEHAAAVNAANGGAAPTKPTTTATATSKPSTTLSTTSKPTVTGGPTVPRYGQCGGASWTGPTKTPAMSTIRENAEDSPVNTGGDARGNSSDTSSDNILLVLQRSFNQFHNFATTFAALYFIGGVRVTFSTGIAAGGNLAYWTSYIVTCVFTFITAAVIAEICSSLPLAGSIYLWAAEAGGPHFGRLFGFVVAWWSTTAWTTFCASNTQAAVNYMLSEIVVFNTDFPSDSSSVKFRAVQWILTEIMLALACIWNLLPPRYFKWIFALSSSIVVLDFLLNLIWLPIATSNTLGFRSTHDAFMTTYNGTGAPPGWNWCLSYLATAGVLIGFDASGHVAEETKNASVAAARGIFWSTVVSGIGGFAVVILFLFCVPDANTLFSYGGPQPFVSVYAAILGEGGHIVMNIVCILALWFNTAIAVTAASRLVFAVARDGVLPWSSWVSKVEAGQPRNAVYVVWGVASVITCTILPSAVAFTSLVSAAGVPSAAAYGLISLARLFLTPKNFPKPAWSLGRLSKPFQVIAVFWNGWVVAVLYSPYVFPVTAESLNYAPIIMAGTTILALLTWWFTPADKWLPSQRIQQTLDADTR